MLTSNRRLYLTGLSVATFLFPCAIFAQGSASTPAPAGSTPTVAAPGPAAQPASPILGATISSAAPTVDLKHYVITDYGAVADGTTMNTVAIQKAIDTATAAGGGVLEIPKGTFLSGSIFLKKGVELYLDEGAVLLGSQNIEDYPKLTTRIEGHFQLWRVAFINIQNMDHVRVGGPGQLNGNGAVYWTAFRRAPRGSTNLDVERPRLMFVDRCSDVQIKNISLQDSGFWNLHVYNSHDVLIEGLTIRGTGPSTDGMDIDSCQNVTIRKCDISVNDDDIALKGSKGPFAAEDKDSPPVENILVEDCTVGNGNGLITCGSEATFVRNVMVRNCTMTGRATLLTLKLRTDTPQLYSNITMDGIKLSGSGTLLSVKPWTQFFDLQGQPPPTHAIDHITIRNVSGSFGSLGTVQGTVGDALRNITLENFDVNLSNTRFTLGPTENFQLKNVNINGQPYELPAPVAAVPLSRAAAALVRPAGTSAAAGTSPAAGTAPAQNPADNQPAQSAPAANTAPAAQ